MFKVRTDPPHADVYLQEFTTASSKAASPLRFRAVVDILNEFPLKLTVIPLEEFYTHRITKTPQILLASTATSFVLLVVFIVLGVFWLRKYFQVSSEKQILVERER